MDAINTIDRRDRSLESAGGESSGPDLTAVRALAQQFESLLLAQMLREMRESLDEESDGDDLGGSMLTDAFTSELGLSLSRSGGVGLSEFLIQSLARRATSGAGAVPTAGLEALSAPASAPTDVVSPGGTMSRAPGPIVNSDFGWRGDPILGETRFHAGQDLRTAYGEEVRAAAGGVVSFAGERGSYVLMVVVDHGGGTETRYAHLSASEVRAGMTVAAGQAIARSGSSGRATGPHLHFEVRQNGQPVDPESVAGLARVTGAAGLDGH